MPAEPLHVARAAELAAPLRRLAAHHEELVALRRSVAHWWRERRAEYREAVHRALALPLRTP